MSTVTFLNHPDLVSIAPVPAPRHVLGGQDLDVRCERKVSHKVGLTIKPKAPSDGPRRSVTLDGRFPKLVDKLARVQLLILDDWGTHGLTDQQRLDLLELFEERYQRRSTVITAQLPVSGWHDMIGEPTIADAILDRIVHNAHRIDIKGDSMRRKDQTVNLTPDENTQTLQTET